MSTDFQQAARQWHGLGLNVVPVKGKIPNLSGWATWQRERIPENVLSEWCWNSDTTGLAVVLGFAHVRDLEFDSIANNEEAEKITDTMLTLLPGVWCYRSGSRKGLHFLFRCEAKNPFRNAVTHAQPRTPGQFHHAELRWEKSLSTVPPSKHESGFLYDWLSEPKELPPIFTVEQVLQVWQALTVETDKREQASTAIDWSVEPGSRHAALCSLIGKLKTSKLSSEILPLALGWNRGLSEPLPEREILATVESLIKDLPPQEKRFSFNVLRGANMSTTAIPEVSDLLRGVLRAKSMNIFAGEEGSGKSILSMNGGIAVATGAPKFLDWVIEKPGKVLFLNNEIFMEDFLRRFQQMTRLLPGKGSLDNFIAPYAVPPLSECFDQLNELCEAEKPALLILDCLYFSHNEDENDSSKMKDVMRQLQALRDRHSTCVLVVHHLRKGGRDQRLNSELMRGSGVFGAAADSILMLRRSQTDESKRILKATKLRHSADENKQARLLSLNPETLWFRDEGPADEDEHIVAAGGTSIEQIDFAEILSGHVLRFSEVVAACKGLEISSKTIQRQLDAAVDRGEVVKPAYGCYSLPAEVGQECPSE